MLEFYMPLNFSGMAEDRIVKFYAWLDAKTVSLAMMINCPPGGRIVKVTWRLNFWQISVNISITVQIKDILTIED